MLTVLLQVRYHREEGKCGAGAHKPGSRRRRTHSSSGNGSGSNEGSAGGTNVRRGVRTSTRGAHGVQMSTGGMNGAPGTVQTSTRVSRYEGSMGGMRRGVLLWIYRFLSNIFSSS